MKTLALSLLLCLISFSAQADIFFPEDGYWVGVQQKSLCVDGDQFRAEVNECTRTRMVRGDDECVEWGKKTIFAPMQYTKEVCVDRHPRLGTCYEYETVTIEQPREKKVCVREVGRSGQCVEYKNVRVPDCN